MTSEIAFCASSSGVRRAASRTTKSLIAASSSQAFPTSSMAGPAHTAAMESSGKTQTAAATNSFKANLVCVSRRPHRQTFPQELAKPLWHAASGRWMICVMDQYHTWDAWYDSISATVSKKLRGWKVRGGNCLDLVLDPIDQVRFSGTVC